MATLQKIRNRGGFLVAIVIGLALISFILGDLFQSGSSLLNRNKMEIGTINGETIQYPDFQRKVEELGEIYKSNTGQTQLDDAAWVQVRDQTWQTYVRENIMGDIYKKAGLSVTSEELFDMLQGNNIHPIVQQIFTNPDTREFDRSAVVNFLKNLETGVSPEQRNYWLYLEKQILSERLQAKYNNLISKALYVTNDEAQQSLKDKNKQVNIEYLAIEQSSMPDSTIKVSDQEIKDYYAAHKDQYKDEKTRKIEYITYNVVPSQTDFTNSEKWISEIRNDFTQAVDNEQFVNSNSDVRFNGAWYKKADVPMDLAGWVNGGATLNSVFGPYFENNSYKLAKLNALENMPDSVKARHILLKAATAEEAQAAQALADSLKKLVDGGSDFAALARQYSTDQGSASVGGELGWFKRGMMVKPFEDAAFKNKVKEVSIVASQFGIHIIQTTERGVGVPQMQFAVLERTVTPSTQTFQGFYAMAGKFVNENDSREKFDAAVAAENLTKKVAVLRENDRTIAALENARPLIRAAFEGKVGSLLKNTDNSPIFEFGNDFVVAILAGVTEDGIAPLESVKERVILEVQKDKKGQLLADKLKAASEGKTDLFSIANSLNTRVDTAFNINFNSVSVGRWGLEPAVVGKAVTIEANKISQPVKGNNAVFIIKVFAVNEAADTNVVAERDRMAQNNSMRASYQAFSALEKSVEIIDKRAKFY